MLPSPVRRCLARLDDIVYSLAGSRLKPKRSKTTTTPRGTESASTGRLTGLDVSETSQHFSLLISSACSTPPASLWWGGLPVHDPPCRLKAVLAVLEVQVAPLAAPVAAREGVQGRAREVRREAGDARRQRRRARHPARVLARSRERRVLLRDAGSWPLPVATVRRTAPRPRSGA